MILSQRILDTLRDNGPIAVRELAKWFDDVDHIDLDATVTRLMRQNSVALALGKYELVAQKSNGKHVPFVATPVSEPPPTAAEEAQASLTPQLFPCAACAEPHPDEAFRHRQDGSRYAICKAAHARKMGLASKGKHNRLKGSQGNPSPTVQSKLGSQIPVETPVSTNENPALNSTHTPREPQGVYDPPAASSEHPSGESVTGRLTPDLPAGDPEALRPVGAGDPLIVLLRDRESQLMKFIARCEQLLEVNRLALTQVRGVLEQLQALEVFE
jgi:hypothetical protein